MKVIVTALHGQTMVMADAHREGEACEPACTRCDWAGPGCCSVSTRQVGCLPDLPPGAAARMSGRPHGHSSAQLHHNVRHVRFHLKNRLQDEVEVDMIGTHHGHSSANLCHNVCQGSCHLMCRLHDESCKCVHFSSPLLCDHAITRLASILEVLSKCPSLKHELTARWSPAAGPGRCQQ